MGQLSLKNILKEIGKEISYVEPNFEYEWEEAVRYPEFDPKFGGMGKEGWIEAANSGHAVQYSSIKNVLGNVELDFHSLEPQKIARFQSAFEEGVIEMPIAVKFSEGDYDLVAGNTRLSGLVNNGIDPMIWVVDISQ